MLFGETYTPARAIIIRGWPDTIFFLNDIRYLNHLIYPGFCRSKTRETRNPLNAFPYSRNIIDIFHRKYRVKNRFFFKTDKTYHYLSVNIEYRSAPNNWLTIALISFDSIFVTYILIFYIISTVKKYKIFHITVYSFIAVITRRDEFIRIFVLYQIIN